MRIGDVGDRDHVGSVGGDDIQSTRVAMRAPERVGRCRSVTVLDVVLLLLLALSAWGGYRRGAVLQVAGLVGLAVGFVVGIWLAPHAADLVRSDPAKAGVALGTVLLLGAIGDAVGSVLGLKLREARPRRLASRSRTRWADPRSRWARSSSRSGSSASTSLRGRSPPSPARSSDRPSSAPSMRRSRPRRSLAAQLGNVLDLIGFPDVFSGLPPLPADPVPQPTRGSRRPGGASGAPVDGADRRTGVRPDPPGHRVRRRGRPRPHERSRDRRQQPAGRMGRADLRRGPGALRPRPRRGDPAGRRPGRARAHALARGGGSEEPAGPCSGIRTGDTRNSGRRHVGRWTPSAATSTRRTRCGGGSTSCRSRSSRATAAGRSCCPAGRSRA